MTLYVFDKDAAGSGKSVCNGGCATNWPPLPVAESAKPIGDFNIIIRDLDPIADHRVQGAE